MARWLLRQVVPVELRGEIEGDLAESYARTQTEKPLSARLRYWREVLSPAYLTLRREARTMALAPGASPNARSGDSLVTMFLRDLRHAVRVLRKSPGFTLIAIVSLGLGIGPNTAIFSVVNGVLLRGPQADRPDRLVDLYNQGESGRWFYSGYWLVERLREEAGDVFSGVSAWVANPAAVEENGTPTSILYELVTGNYFDVLGIAPERGRFFLPEEDSTLGTHPVTVISHAYWQSRLGGADALGTDLRINGRPYTIIGIAPKGFTGKALPGVQTDLWLPYHMYPHLSPGQETNGNLGITARVREGVPVATAVAAVDALSQRIDADRKARGSKNEFVLGAFPWSGMYLHPDLDGPIVAVAALLLVVVGLVLLVACINLAGFLLARATDRRREIAVRRALGAGRGAIVRQLLIESLVLGAAGGVVGLALGMLTLRALASLNMPLPLPISLSIPLDGSVLLYTAGVSLVAGLLFGLTPALQASRSPVSQVLRDEGNAVAGGRGKLSLRNVLVVGQVALSVVLLVAAGLFLRSLRATTAIDPGFDTGPAAILDLNGQASGYESGRDMVAPIDAALRTLAVTQGVTGATFVTRVPLGLGSWVRFYDVPGVPPPEGRDNHRFEYTAVSPGYFDVMGIPILAGRAFVEADGPDAPPVAIVSRALAERLWHGESPVGRTLISIYDRDNPITIVGMADDIDVWTLGEEPRPYLYLPFPQAPAAIGAVITRGTLRPARLQAATRDALRAADPNLFVQKMSTMDERLADTVFLPRMAAILIGAFAVLAVVLSTIGLYGVVSYGVARRTREMGIRMSLGAGRGDVIGLVVRGGALLAVTGVGIGILAALVASGLLQRFLIGVTGRDPLTLIAAPLFLVVVAIVAAFLPARRASKIDPMVALRAE